MRKHFYLVTARRLLVALSAMCTMGVSAAVQSGRIYRISFSQADGRTLFPQNSKPDANTAVLAWTNTGVPAQLWTAESTGDGTFTLRNAYTGGYLGLPGSPTTASRLVQLSTATANARWTITESAEKAGVYSITQKTTRATFALTLAADSDGARPTLTEIADVAAPSAEQQWALTECTPGDLTLTREVRAAMGESFLKNNFRKRSNGYYSFGNGGWGEAETLETMLDAYETSGDKRYLDAFEKAYNYFIHCVGTNWLILKYDKDYNWFGHDFNDDVMWMIIAAARAYHLTGKVAYLNQARTNFDAIYKRGYDQWGMMRWAMQSGSANGTNSCINGPTEVAACYIAMGCSGKTLRDKYYNIARSLYDKQRRFLFNSATGEVYDAFSWNTETNMPGGYNKWVSTYNQGTMLGAAVMLYDHFGDAIYKSDADKIVACTRSRLCDSYGIVKVCQNVSGTYCGFKGILMRYLRRYVTDMQHPGTADWLRDNALRAYNNRNSYGITTSAWLTKATENWITTAEKNDDGSYKNFKDEPFGNSTAVSAAFNAPLAAHAIMKDGSSPIEAEDFDYVRGVYVVEDTTTHALGLTNAANSYYTVYSNVNFGTRTMRSLTFSLRAAGAGYAIEIYADSIGGSPLGSVAVPKADALTDITTAIRPIDGQHDIYLVYRKRISSARDFFLDRMSFTTDAPALTADLTDGAAIVSATDSLSPAALFDNRAATTVLREGHSATFLFSAIAPATLAGYALANSAYGNRCDPQSWTLSGRNEGGEWETIDSREGVSFDTSCRLLSYSVAGAKAYRNFRLEVTATGDSVGLGEWQLYGTAISADDITADGGKLTDGDSAAIDKSAATNGHSALYAYTSNGNYQPTLYSITVTDTASAPRAWTLYGYADKEWQVLDSRSGESFRAGGCTMFYPITTTLSCQRFRLELTDGTERQQIAEWQVFGTLRSSAQLYTDLTCSLGTITSSDGASARTLAAAIDDDASTAVRINRGEGENWIEYTSPVPIRLTGYSVCAGNDVSAAPYSWQLLASNDGAEWTRLNITSGANLRTRGKVRTVSITNSRTFTHFRLLMTRATDLSATAYEIGDFQLYGRCIADSSIVTGATMTAEFPNSNTAEDVAKAADSNISTKFLFNSYGGGWLTATLSTPACANVYAISSANDNASRDPQSWQLQGSDDGETWTTLDSRSGEAFYNRNVTQIYTFSNARSYGQYRLLITDNGGDALCQLSELQLFAHDESTTGISDVKRTTGRLTATVTDGGSTLSVTLPAAAVVSVYASDGTTILSRSLPAGNSRVRFATAGRGIYIIRATGIAGTLTAKVVK